jgi:GTP-binding protein
LKVLDCRLLTSASNSAAYPRGGLPEVAFLGRSNVGKSSLLNQLLGRGLARTSRTPGRTQQAHFYSVNDTVLFVDLPGYGYARAPTKVRVELAGIIETYLSARRPLAVAVMIIDSRHDPSELDMGMYKWLGNEGIPIQIVGTKIDKLSRQQQHASLSRTGRIMCLSGREDIIPFSSETGEGKRELWQAIDNRIASLRSQAPASPTAGPRT